MKTETDVKRLFNFLMTGCKVNRVIAWNKLRIADLRSRICDIEKEYHLTIYRNTVKGKRYREYFIKNNVL